MGITSNYLQLLDASVCPCMRWLGRRRNAYSIKRRICSLGYGRGYPRPRNNGSVIAASSDHSAGVSRAILQCCCSRSSVLIFPSNLVAFIQRHIHKFAIHGSANFSIAPNRDKEALRNLPLSCGWVLGFSCFLFCGCLRLMFWARN